MECRFCGSKSRLVIMPHKHPMMSKPMLAKVEHSCRIGDVLMKVEVMAPTGEEAVEAFEKHYCGVESEQT